MIIYSLGHSNRSINEFLERIKTYRINRLVDIRTRPYSRFCPWFNQKSLSAQLSAAGVLYDFRGNNLGGLGENIDYHETLEELVGLAKSERIAIMCSEADYKKCHRHLNIEPDLVNLGTKVEHILYVKSSGLPQS